MLGVGLPAEHGELGREASRFLSEVVEGRVVVSQDVLEISVEGGEGDASRILLGFWEIVAGSQEQSMGEIVLQQEFVFLVVVQFSLRLLCQRNHSISSLQTEVLQKFG